MDGLNKTHYNSQFNKCSHCRIAHLCLPSFLSKQALRKLSEFKFSAHLLDPGEHLCYQGNLHQHLYLLRSGVLKSYYNKVNGEELIMSFHLPPGLFGWEGIDDQQLSFSIQAIDYSNVCEIPLSKLYDLAQQIPEVQKQLMKFFSQRIRNNNAIFLRTSAEQRVVTFLLYLAHHDKMLGYPYYLCRLVMTHQDIANYLRLAPETISRIFRKLQQKELITVRRKKVYLHDLEALQVIAQDETVVS